MKIIVVNIESGGGNGLWYREWGMGNGVEFLCLCTFHNFLIVHNLQQCISSLSECLSLCKIINPLL